MGVMTVENGCMKIRMYRPGFGDCFLLAFPGGDETKYVLIDCGVHQGTSGQKQKMTKIANSIKDASGGHIHLLVVSHEHADHINGFERAREVFEQITIDTVWMGWTEDYDDPRVKNLEEKFGLYLSAVNLAKGMLQKRRTRERHSAPSSVERSLVGTLGFYEDLGANNGRPDHATMKWLKQKAHSVTYCEPGSESLALHGLKAVRFYVLGPPLQESRIEQSDPSSGAAKETYLTDRRHDQWDDFVRTVMRLNDLGLSFDLPGNEPLPNREPFDARYRIPQELWKNSDFRSLFNQTYFKNGEEWRKIDDRWLDPAEELALKLQEHTNNTSLALAIELENSGNVLLFPGDAQVGNWLGWQDLAWDVDGGTIKANDLLARTVFYKVGHHGSHNATLKQQGLEKMTHRDLMAMIPVDEKYAKEKQRWMHIPHEPLLTRLREKCRNRVIRSDDRLPDENHQPDGLSRAKWKDFLERIKGDPLYVDLSVKM